MPIQRAKPIAADIPVINTSSLPTIPAANFPSGSIIQVKSKVLEPGVDFNADLSSTSTSYIDIAGNVSSTKLQVSMTGIKSNSTLVYYYQCGLVRNNSNPIVYNIYETVGSTYVANATTYASANDPYIAGHWSTTDHTGLVMWYHQGEAGQYTGDRTFKVQVKQMSGSGTYYWHWHSTRVGHSLTVMEIAG